jgi:outer membrane lipoprotein carrier protein
MSGMISIGYAADDSATLSGLLQGVKTLKANFSQQTYDGRGKQTQHSNGRMALQRPGLFRWEITKPIPQLIIANRNTLWVYDPDLEQVTIRNLNYSAGEAPALLLSHDNASLEDGFKVTTMPSKQANMQWFSLAPKKPDNMFERIEIGFSNKVLNQMRLQDHLGNTTSIQFTNIQSNQTVNASLFTFKAPAGIDVIDERKRSK